MFYQFFAEECARAQWVIFLGGKRSGRIFVRFCQSCPFAELLVEYLLGGKAGARHVRATVPGTRLHRFAGLRTGQDPHRLQAKHSKIARHWSVEVPDQTCATHMLNHVPKSKGFWLKCPARLRCFLEPFLSSPACSSQAVLGRVQAGLVSDM